MITKLEYINHNYSQHYYDISHFIERIDNKTVIALFDSKAAAFKVKYNYIVV
jgi:hypothetical protein